MVIRRYGCFKMYLLCENERKVLSNYHNNRINNFNNMEKKNLLFVAAAMVMAGCASDDMIGDNGATQSDNQVIGFNMNGAATTRADAAHTQLGNMFIVWGEKNEGTDGKKASAANLVFKNYKVTWADNTANTTLSNTKNWEYVGVAPFKSNENVTPYISETSQTIKYWDYQANSYTFTAVSAVETEITGGKVIIESTCKSGI